MNFVKMYLYPILLITRMFWLYSRPSLECLKEYKQAYNKLLTRVGKTAWCDV
jgi:hypothetical protein